MIHQPRAATDEKAMHQMLLCDYKLHESTKDTDTVKRTTKHSPLQ